MPNQIARTALLHPPAPPKTLVSMSSRDADSAHISYPLKLFHAVAARVPAYKDFLKRHRISPDRVRSCADLRSVPTIDKKNYLTQYPLEALCWDGKLKGKALTYTSSSGSTGAPFYFPRTEQLDFRSSLIFESYLHSISRGKTPSTLFVVSFGMGVWIGGLISFESLRMVGQRGFPISVVTPGSNKREVFEALRRLAPMYDQVVLGGYPPFVKDILDEAPEHGIDTAKTPLKLFFAAEPFSETFRDYVMRKAGVDDAAFDTGSIYGTADIGTMALETPLAIALRRRAVKEPKLYETLFSGVTKLPTLAQFHPAVTHFDEIDGQLYVTGDSALPLVRYALGDHGGVRGYDAMLASAESASPGILKDLRDATRLTPQLPFVYVYERADFSTKLYGAIIFAEHVREALQAQSLERNITGKFTMKTSHDEKQNEFLEINVELRSGTVAADSLTHEVCEAVFKTLCAMSAEYRNSAMSAGERLKPRITLLPFAHPDHFGPGGKQKWVIK